MFTLKFQYTLIILALTNDIAGSFDLANDVAVFFKLGVLLDQWF